MFLHFHAPTQGLIQRMTVATLLILLSCSDSLFLSVSLSPFFSLLCLCELTLLPRFSAVIIFSCFFFVRISRYLLLKDSPPFSIYYAQQTFLHKCVIQSSIQIFFLSLLPSCPPSFLLILFYSSLYFFSSSFFLFYSPQLNPSFRCYTDILISSSLPEVL